MTKFINGLEEVDASCTGCAVTIGNFDGVHRGHQYIVQQLKLHKKKFELSGCSIPTMIIIFEPQPAEFLRPLEEVPPRINDLNEKVNQLSKLGVDYVLCLKFDECLQKISAKLFIEDILMRQLKIQYLCVGSDFRFGKGKKGDFKHLEAILTKHRVRVDKIDFLLLNGEKVSSSNIRSCLQQGDFQTAKNFLGRGFSICGTVVHGNKLGRQITTATANIALQRKKLILHGVFIVTVSCLRPPIKNAPAIANMGYNPTMDNNQPLLEVHLLNYSDNVYGSCLEVVFLHKIRDERKFGSIGLLQQQINQDKEQAYAWFRRYS